MTRGVARDAPETNATLDFCHSLLCCRLWYMKASSINVSHTGVMENGEVRRRGE